MNLRRLAVIVLLALGIFFTACGEKGPTELHFTITFKDAQQLRPGQFVMYKGVRIGQVSAVELGGSGLVNVHVTIEKEQRERVYREAKFTIEKLSMLNATGEHQVVMDDRGDTHTPLEDGATVTGSEGWLGDAVDATKGAIGAAADAVKKAVGTDTAPPPPAPSTQH